MAWSVVHQHVPFQNYENAVEMVVSQTVFTRLLIRSQKGRQVLWMDNRSSFGGGGKRRDMTYGTISSCRPERNSIGTSVIEGRKVSEAQT